VDGQPDRPGIGEFAVVLGERNEDTVVAAYVYAFTSPPDITAGPVTDVAGSTVTIGLGDQATSVDLASNGNPVPVLLNGTSIVDPSTLTTADTLLVIGTDNADGTFTGSVAFAFNTDNRGPAGDNDDGPDGDRDRHHGSGDSPGDDDPDGRDQAPNGE
jgi:hypothetical protein